MSESKQDAAATPGQAARDLLASAVRDLFGGDCPNDPCPQCKRREDELMDLADDYAGAAAPDEHGSEESTRLRTQNHRLRGQLQAVRQLMEQAAASGIVDSRAILDLLATAPAEPEPAPELAALHDRLKAAAGRWGRHAEEQGRAAERALADPALERRNVAREGHLAKASVYGALAAEVDGILGEAE